MLNDDLNWVKVMMFDDFWEGDFVDVEVDGEQVIIIYMLGGCICVYQGMCFYQEILLVDGKIDFDVSMIICLVYEWEFSMEMGKGINFFGCCFFYYDVRLDGDDVFIVVLIDGWLCCLCYEVEEVQGKIMMEEVILKFVGLIICGVDDDIINVVIDVVEEDNLDCEIYVEDCLGYVWVQVEKEFVFIQCIMVEKFGWLFCLFELELSFVFFVGCLMMLDDKWEWVLKG